jgi:metal-dependent amidase/aminoacylase/carboxypeptidase family protein
MFEEHKTSAYIRQQLDDLDIPYKYPFAKTGIVGRVGQGKPIIALRADIDALPIQERTGLHFASQNSGRMHACGHDGEGLVSAGAAAVGGNIDTSNSCGHTHAVTPSVMLF